MANKNITMKQKTANGFDVLYPSTTISQVSGLSDALAEKLLKAFTTYTQKTTLVGNDLLAINDSADSNAVKKITVQSLKDFIQDPHNKGYYATPTALNTAWPAANCSAGDYAVVGTTDTVWIFDADTSAWVDSDKHGEVTSVNGQTGAVNVPTPGNLTVGGGSPQSMSSDISLAAVAGSGSYNDLSNLPTIQRIIVDANEPVSADIATGDFWYEVLS